MERVNYHHLLYFWIVAKEGSIAAAAKRLNLSQPTISTQLRALEDTLGVELFDRSGRRLVLSETGRVALRYAEKIFSLGRELVEVLHEHGGGQRRTAVGITPAIPKLLAHRLLSPALGQDEGGRAICREDRFDRLLGGLARRELDLVISDAPLGSEVPIKAFNHPLGSCGLTFFAARALAPKYRRSFPKSLDGAPFLAPAPDSALRRELDQWFEGHGLRPQLVGQFDDNTLLELFGQSGAGVFVGPTAIEKEIKRQYGVHVVGRTDEVLVRLFAISLDRRLKHPGVLAICEAAKIALPG